MNRGNPPPEYVAQVSRMVRAAHAWIGAHRGERPHFKLPPKDPLVIAVVDDVLPKIAQNPAAFELGHILGTDGASLLMLDVALQMVEGVKVDRFTADEVMTWGKVVALSPGGNA